MDKLNILITAGGTSEYIDAVRKITNSSSGKLGSIIANEFSQKNNINKIFYICTPKSIKPNMSLILQNGIDFKLYEITTTMELKEVIEDVLKNEKIDYFIHSMAISDYYVDYVSTASLLSKNLKESNNYEETLKKPIYKLDNSSKLSSNEDNLILVLKQTPKIIKMIKEISPNTHLIGFKLLENVKENELIEVGYNLLLKNNCDYVLANDLKNITNNKHIGFLIDKNKNYKRLETKEEIAKALTFII